ncbi:A24 family peptidase [Paenibacillus sp. S150]|uniref:prepilin peptidase n=1 Tax=Paenibacillus sp. S150 TaxID=2749826 RepID=UPI001C55C965|nr:A24 family peptidase [Paenibacillus sp. S150]MBW4085255.1 prepilin peptidase [Paenibacillus sp. S150]
MSLLSAEVIQGILFMLLLLYASLRDLKTRQIPDSLPLAIVIVGLLRFSPVYAFLGLLVAGLPYLIAAVCSKGKIGGGDIKLMAACGFVLGPVYGTLQSIIGLTLVLLAAAGIGFRAGFQTAKQTALPLAPFLSAGGVLAFLIHLLS